MAEHPFESCHVLFYTRAVRSAAARGRRSRLHRSHPHSAAGDSCRSRRGRSIGRRADRHRQDRRIRPADAAAAIHTSVAACGGAAQTAARADSNADARVGGAGRSVHQDLRKASEAHLDGADRRRRVRTAGSAVEARRRFSGGDAGPPARSSRSRQRRFFPGRDLCARRGGPHARHGLHPRRQARPRPAPEAAPEPAFLCHIFGRDQGACRQVAEPAAHDRSDTAQFHRRRDCAACASGEPRGQKQTAGVAGGSPSLAAGAGVHPDQAWRRQARQLAAQRWHRRRGVARQQEPERAHAGIG